MEISVQIKQGKNDGAPLPDIYSREMVTNVHTKTCVQMFLTTLLMIAKKWT